MTYRIPNGMTCAQWIRHLLDTEHCLRKFYLSTAWKRKRASILAAAHNECADCIAMSPARYSRATCVHHDQHVPSRPDLALSEFRTLKDGSVARQLVPLCDSCHNARHGRFGCSCNRIESNRDLEPERW